MAELEFPNTPTGSLADLWRAVLRLLPQLTRRVVRGVAIATVETPVAHGLRVAPQTANVLAQANAVVWETKAPDSRYVYLAASVATTANVEFVP